MSDVWDYSRVYANPVWAEEFLGDLNPADPASMDFPFCGKLIRVVAKRYEVPNFLAMVLMSRDALKNSQFPYIRGRLDLPPREIARAHMPRNLGIPLQSLRA